MNARSLSAVSCAAMLAFGLVPGDDVATKLKSKDPIERAGACDAIRRDGAKDAEKLLTTALSDRDWEVIEHAAAALVWQSHSPEVAAVHAGDAGREGQAGLGL